VVKSVGDVAMVEQRAMMEGRRMVMIIGPRGGVIRSPSPGPVGPGPGPSRTPTSAPAGGSAPPTGVPPGGSPPAQAAAGKG